MPCTSCARRPEVTQSQIPDHGRICDDSIGARVLASVIANREAVVVFVSVRVLVTYRHRFTIRGRLITESRLAKTVRADEDPRIVWRRLVELDFSCRSHSDFGAR